MSKSNLQAGSVSTDSSSAVPSNFRQRILIVDDEREILRLNAEVLRCSGFDVDTAEDGADAWAKLETNTYDLLLTDYEMPKVSGLELLQKIRAAHLALPAILTTGIFPEEEAEGQPRLHIEAVLLKPYGIDELLDVVKNVLHTANSGRTEICPPNWQPLAAATELRVTPLLPQVR